MRHGPTLLLLATLAAGGKTHAETLYVIEQLVVSVNSAADASGDRIATLKSGESVEVLGKQGDQVHVHLANGTEGWVRKSYLSAEEPLQHRLDARTAEVDQLKQDVARLQAQLAAARATPASKQGASRTNVGASADPAVAPVPTQPEERSHAGSATDPAATEPSYFMTPPEAPARPVWHWALGSFALALALGYGLGWQALDRRIRRKYGGLRIY